MEKSASPKDVFIFASDFLVLFSSNFGNGRDDDQTESILEVKMMDLEDRWNKLQIAYSTLNISLDGQDKEFMDSARGKFHSCSESYYDCKSRILDLLRLKRGGMRQLDMTTPMAPLPPSGPSAFSGLNIKLPPCDTEIFEGGYEEWPSFRDMFIAIYVNHPKLTPAQKLFHLRNKTRGEAGAIVKRYTLCDETFPLAWEALKLRYENTRVLVDCQLRILFNIPIAGSEDSQSIQNLQATVNDCLARLKTLGVSTDDWDPLLIYLVSTKLPEKTLALWEQSLDSHRSLPKWSQMNSFLINRYEIVERITSIKETKTFFGAQVSPVHSYITEDKSDKDCRFCSASHSIRACPGFKQLSVSDRINFVFENKICNNCLSSSHMKKECKSKHSCAECKQFHHTLLHLKKQKTPLKRNDAPPQTPLHTQDQPSCSNQAVFLSSSPEDDLIACSPTLFTSQPNMHSHVSSNYTNVLLRTALVPVEYLGEIFTIRALIDSGSQRTFISERIRNRLRLPTKRSPCIISGIGCKTQSSDKECDITLCSKDMKRKIVVSAIILPKVTNYLPSFTIKPPNLEAFSEIQLADPFFFKSAQIDLILGEDNAHHVEMEGIIKNICGHLSAHNTIFGWVISGPVPTTQSFSATVSPSDNIALNDLLRKFWETEEIPNFPKVSSQDTYCEDYYKETTRRTPEGRYIVRLPFKQEFNTTLTLGPSRAIAFRQYSRIEKSLTRHTDLFEDYRQVLNEYLTLDHMEEISSCERQRDGKYQSFYLPHHAVIRPESRTTRVRVVFNGSRRTNTGLSLNDVLHPGPTLQSDLMSILLYWRSYRYVFSGDVQKMYRQILIHPDDRPFQRVLFRRDQDTPVTDFELKTVTFGINCAPFLAIRTLLQLANDSEMQYPLAAPILRRETYVDDILSGGHSLNDALLAQSQLISVLNSAGFPLRKITSNNAKLLDHLPPQDLYDSNFLQFYEASSTKTLGVQWNALTDCFSYSFNNDSASTAVTKREILSAVAKLYDPAGWLSPIVIQAKILMQSLWLEGLGWDQSVSPTSQTRWQCIASQLPLIQDIQIPRWIDFGPSDNVQIHGFCDSSQRAYCAAVYVRVQNSAGIFSNLLVSKTKVAPLETISLPRLELCGALLLSKLVKRILSFMPFKDPEVFLWCDSLIVLGWLGKPPYMWKTYIANRVSQIRYNLPNSYWRHVPTEQNPADLGTRGCRASELKDNTLWWQGPTWLGQGLSDWPQPIFPRSPEVERRKVESFPAVLSSPDPLENFSCYARALRVFCYVFRFYNNCSKIYARRHTQDLISQQEISFVRNRFILLSQKSYYSQEYSDIANSKIVAKKSPLSPLNPFLDGNGLLRVNGRLATSELPYNEKFPIILPHQAHFTKLYLEFIHILLLHGECSLMCRIVNTEFHISRLKYGIKRIIHHCKICTIYKKRACTQIMAPLPAERCTFSMPFETTGIDFAGPFELKSSKLRNAPIIKGYASVFICFSTKAIHLEPCSELTASAFLAAFSRFVGRRGLPKKVVSDNGRNFIGASRTLLKEFKQFIKKSSAETSQKYVVHGLEWSFIPPHAPHMGGLWEAAVKSFKFHFRRIMSSHRCTFEEFATILARIEGVLNSRPISALSQDPNDISALTPGHFLRGGPIMALPELHCDNLSLLNRWEKLKGLHHQFAVRWKEDYLRNLQKRYKWKAPLPNINQDDLVVVIDDLLPPSEWRLGRVQKVYTGTDNNVRIADIRTESGIINRPIVKLCLLPFKNTT